MRVRFWGTRGSIATPGPSTVRYGGNTSCVEVRSGDSLAIIDCGTGARSLGASMAGQGGRVHAHLFITHFHWDHIQGFPFFLPAFLPQVELEVFGTPGMERGLEEALAGQMQYTYFPVRLEELRSRLSYHEVGEETFRAGDFGVTTHHLNHPAPTIGYRLEAGGGAVAYLSDHEPFWPHDSSRSIEDLLLHPADRRHVDFAAGADLLIHDAQYGAEEYPARRGWGHSTVEYAVDVAVAAKVARLALYHHDPARTDDAVDELVERAQRRARDWGADLEVFGAAEGLVVELPEEAAATVEAGPRVSVAAQGPARVLILGDPDRRAPVREALTEEGYRLSEAALDGTPTHWAALEPDLVVFGAGAVSGVVRAARAVKRAIADCPLVVVIEGLEDQLVLRQIGEEAADVIAVPFAVHNLRARVRACLARKSPGRASGGRPPRVAEGLQIVEQLPAVELTPMLQAGARCSFRPGEVLFEQGGPPNGIYYLYTGRVRVVVETLDGRQVTVGYGGPGDTMGEMSAVDGATRSATVVALDPVEASYISREGFQEALGKNPDVALRVLRMLSRRLRATDALFAEVVAPEAAPGGPEGTSADEAAALRKKLGQLKARLEQMGLPRELMESYAGTGEGSRG